MIKELSACICVRRCVFGDKEKLSKSADQRIEARGQNTVN